MPAFQDRDVTSSGVRLRVSEAGEGRPIVLLHGALRDRSTWIRVGERLSGEFRVVLVDLPGFGDSEKPPPTRYRYGIDAFVEAVTDLHAALGLSRAALVGHGLGGCVAVAVAARRPELVSRLVIVNAPLQSTLGSWRSRMLTAPLVGGVVVKQLTGPALFRWAVLDGGAGEAGSIDGVPLIERYYESFDTPAARGSALATLRASADVSAVIADLGRVRAPALVVWGRHDRVVPAGVGQRVARELRGAGFELVDAGHAPHEERPAEVAAALGRFLRAERA
ncbi:MAG: alpha/beta hydrolase [Polyangiaceae bacterium]|nr:alpha/beta hydrolase [Polyangiaceae bacterium]